jgi:CheY-like chemotaxis protein
MAFTVLVVDEELSVLNLAKERLEPLGCEVVESNYSEAASVAQARKLSLVLLGTRSLTA